MTRITSETLVWKTRIGGQVETLDVPAVGRFSNEASTDELPILILGGMAERLGTSSRLVRHLGKA